MCQKQTDQIKPLSLKTVLGSASPTTYTLITEEHQPVEFTSA